jgi:hypothetical protein
LGLVRYPMLSFPMTDAQFAAAVSRLRSDGIEISGPSGTLTKDGITAKYIHANGTLTVEITDRPFFVPVSLIEGKLKAYFGQV